MTTDHSAAATANEAHVPDGDITGTQRRIVAELASRGPQGATWKEIGQALSLHHGQVTGALSSLHRRAVVSRLALRRDHCSVYVVPEHVAGRETTVQGRTKAALSEPQKAAITEFRWAQLMAQASHGPTVSVSAQHAADLVSVLDQVLDD